MRRKLFFTLSLLSCLSAFSLSPRAELLVHFPSDVCVVDDHASQELMRFLSTLDLRGDHEFIVHGHTDSEGSMSYNEQLGMARAMAVRSFLADHGIDAARITIEGFGEREPLARNIAEEDLALNRRVQVTFNRHAYGDLNELLHQLADGTVQQFIIDPTQDQLLPGANGTSLYVPANAIVDELGHPVKGPVTMTITEAVEYDAMMAHGLSTRAGDRLLETSGMMKVEAFDAAGRTLTLAPAANMVASLPPEVRSDDMQLFTSTTGSDWTATGRRSITSATATVEWGFKWPTPPRRRYPGFFSPPFKAQKDMPHRPADPVYPAHPREPQADRYLREPRWYQFLWANKLRASGERRYADALRNYEHAIRRFDKRVVEYEEDCASMPDRLVAWREKLIAWHEKQRAAEDEWRRTVSEPARQRHKAMVAKKDPQYDSLMTAYEAQLEVATQRYTRYMDSLGVAQRGLVGNYLFNVNSFGWINCDRFYNVPQEQKYEVIVQNPDPTEEHVYLVFTGINSIVRIHDIGNGYRYPDIPYSEPAAVLALKVIDGQVFISNKRLMPFEEQRLDFTPSSFAELRRTMRELTGEEG